MLHLHLSKNPITIGVPILVETSFWITCGQSKEALERFSLTPRNIWFLLRCSDRPSPAGSKGWSESRLWVSAKVSSNRPLISYVKNWVTNTQFLPYPAGEKCLWNLQIFVSILGILRFVMSHLLNNQLHHPDSVPSCPAILLWIRCWFLSPIFVRKEFFFLQIQSKPTHSSWGFQFFLDLSWTQPCVFDSLWN